MKSLFCLAAVVLGMSTMSLAASNPDDQQACLESVMARYGEAQKINKLNMNKDLDRCAVSGSDEFSDRCYGIGMRRFERASVIAEQTYKAEMSACLH